MLSTLVDKPFNDKHWVFEIKWDGVRSIFFLTRQNEYWKLNLEVIKSLLIDIQN